MKWIASFLAFSLALAVCGATEIFAWKVPLSYLAPGEVHSPGVVRLDTAPEKSPFFAEGDELWDIRVAVPGEIAKAGAPPEWAVWNATSGRIVTKGPPIVAVALYHHLGIEELPTVCRIGIDVFRVPDGGAPPDFSGKPDASISFIGRGGTRSNGSISEKGAEIRSECELTISEDKTIIDSAINLSASLPNYPKLEISTSASTCDHTGVWLARDYDGKSGIDIRYSVTLELTDGTPYSEAVLKQDGETFLPLQVDRSHKEPMAIGDGWLVSQWVGSWFFQRLLEEIAPNEEPDPFAPGDEVKGLAWDKVHLSPIPDKLTPYFAGPVLDMGEELRRAGIEMAAGDFAGHDLGSQRAFFYSSNRSELNKFEAFCDVGLGQPNSLAITTRGDYQMRLVAKSGRKANLTSIRSDPKFSRKFEIEPTLGHNSSFVVELVDLRFLFEEKSGETLVRSLNSAATLAPGEFTKVLEGKLPDGGEPKMEIKVEVLRPR